MPTKRTRSKPEPDFNQLAHHQIKTLTDPREEESRPAASEISRVMAKLGRRGGKIGGARRAAGMTDKQRSKAASLAAKARWANHANASAQKRDIGAI
jgi:hypothetical protein